MQHNDHVIAFWHHKLHAPTFPFTHKDLYTMWTAQNRLRDAKADSGQVNNGYYPS